MAWKNDNVRKYADKQLLKLQMRLYIRPCNGMCGNVGTHTHDLRILGKWHFIWRYKVQDLIFRDPRPHPPVDDLNGAPWIDEYEAEWVQDFPGYNMESCFVRDAQGFWVWVTNTPQWDRNWFDKKGWRFPTAWITGPSKTFYKIGQDAVSTVVSLPTAGKSNVPVEGEVW